MGLLRSSHLVRRKSRVQLDCVFFLEFFVACSWRYLMKSFKLNELGKNGVAQVRMLMWYIKAIILISLVFALLGAVEVRAESESLYVMCRNNGLVRTVRIVQKPEGCVTIYTKAGTDRVVGSGRYLISCVGVLKNIKANLEKAWWKCRDISQSQVSQSYELGVLSDESEEPKKP